MKRNSGQIAVFVLLMLLVGLTVGLSVTARTLQDLKQSSVSDQSSRAFSAAEAGIEYLLNNDLSSIASTNPTGTVTLPGGTVGVKDIKYSISGNSSTEFRPSGAISKDDVLTVNLTGYTGGSVTVFWTQKNSLVENPIPASCTEGTGMPAAMLFTYYISDGTNYAVRKEAYNPSTCGSLSGPTGNSFSTSSLPAAEYLSSVTSTVPANTQVLRLRPIYNDASIRVTGVGLPTNQGFVINAVASGENASTTRAVRVTKTAPTLSPIFDYALFTAGNIGP